MNLKGLIKTANWKYLIWGVIAIASQLVPFIPDHVSDHIDTICELFGAGSLLNGWVGSLLNKK
jgi:hypothetical protein